MSTYSCGSCGEPEQRCSCQRTSATGEAMMSDYECETACPHRDRLQSERDRLREEVDRLARVGSLVLQDSRWQHIDDARELEALRNKNDALRAEVDAFREDAANYYRLAKEADAQQAALRARVEAAEVERDYLRSRYEDLLSDRERMRGHVWTRDRAPAAQCKQCGQFLDSRGKCRVPEHNL